MTARAIIYGRALRYFLAENGAIYSGAVMATGQPASGAQQQPSMEHGGREPMPLGELELEQEAAQHNVMGGSAAHHAHPFDMQGSYGYDEYGASANLPSASSAIVHSTNAGELAGLRLSLAERRAWAVRTGPGPGGRLARAHPPTPPA